MARRESNLARPRAMRKTKADSLVNAVTIAAKLRDQEASILQQPGQTPEGFPRAQRAVSE